MLKFEDELQKFKPVLTIDRIEEEIALEDMNDLIDLIKNYRNEDKANGVKENGAAVRSCNG